MHAIIIRRLLLMLPLMVGMTLIAFIVSHSVPADPVAAHLGQRSMEDKTIVAAFRQQLGLDKPLPEQYLTYVRNLAQGNMGTSIRQVPLTSSVGYFRFHGRNYKNWWSHGEAEDRYNYLYTPEEQRELASDVQDVAAHTSETYAFYNNHYGAKAVVNALQLQTALGQPPATLELPEPLRATFPDLLGA